MRVGLPAAALLLLHFAACMPPETPVTAPGKMRIVTGIAPVGYLARTIGGEDAIVTVLLPPGANPHSFELRPSQMQEIAGARLFLSVGLPFEQAIGARLSGRESLTLLTLGAGIERQREPAHDQGDEAEDDHVHAVMEDDPHIWFTPAHLTVLAGEIRDVLCATDPDHAESFRRRHEDLRGKLAALETRLSAALERLRGKRFYVYHAAFGYLAAAYGLEQVAVETGGKEPSPRQIATLIERARADRVRVIFVQPQFSPRSAEAIARAIGGAVVPVDPEANDPVAELERMATVLSETLATNDRDVQ